MFLTENVPPALFEGSDYQLARAIPHRYRYLLELCIAIPHVYSKPKTLIKI